MTDQANNTAAQAKPKFVPKVIGNVTLPLMKIVANVDYYVRFTGDIHLGKEIAGQAKVDPETGEIKGKKEPAFVAFVDNLETENPVQIIVSTVMRKELIEQYPDSAYVGKCFMFSLTRPTGKSYNVPQIAEIEDPNPGKGIDARAKFDAKRALAPATDTPTTEANNATEAPKAKAKK